MFEYLVDDIKFKQKLGNYISHEVVSYFDGAELILRSMEELNKLDRLELATTFYNKTHKDYFEGGIDGVDMKEQIAEYIDKKIPIFYKKKAKPKRSSPNHYLEINISIPIYLYEIEKFYEDTNGQNFGEPLSSIMDVLDKYRKGKGNAHRGYGFEWKIEED